MGVNGVDGNMAIQTDAALASQNVAQIADKGADFAEVLKLKQDENQAGQTAAPAGTQVPPPEAQTNAPPPNTANSVQASTTTPNTNLGDGKQALVNSYNSQAEAGVKHPGAILGEKAHNERAAVAERYLLGIEPNANSNSPKANVDVIYYEQGRNIDKAEIDGYIKKGDSEGLKKYFEDRNFVGDKSSGRGGASYAAGVSKLLIDANNTNGFNGKENVALVPVDDARDTRNNPVTTAETRLPVNKEWTETIGKDLAGRPEGTRWALIAGGQHIGEFNNGNVSEPGMRARLTEIQKNSAGENVPPTSIYIGTGIQGVLVQKPDGTFDYMNPNNIK